MATPNMSTITASLEKSLKNFSLNNHHHHLNGDTSSGGVVAENSPEIEVVDSASPTLELNSEALPYHWEQCLDLKTGELYYINWRTGMRTSEDPRISSNQYLSDEYESYDEDDDDDDSSSESSPSSSREQWSKEDRATGESDSTANPPPPVLVVAGCKGCFMYYMVPKQNEVCPKCCGQLIHFDRSENGNGNGNGCS